MILSLHLLLQDFGRPIELAMVQETLLDDAASLGIASHKAKNSYQGFKYLA